MDKYKKACSKLRKKKGPCRKNRVRLRAHIFVLCSSWRCFLVTAEILGRERDRDFAELLTVSQTKEPKAEFRAHIQ